MKLKKSVKQISISNFKPKVEKGYDVALQVIIDYADTKLLLPLKTGWTSN